MTITPSDLQREAKIASLKQHIANAQNQIDGYQANKMKYISELADLLGMVVCGDAIVEKV